ncbi:hypothetical protein D4764_06G0007210 [Takifugu flavidus]|uniref:Murine leukemia virus integrase C-terminal domain-containing protein n=1 Tax=Takifugu flavidus TaxID=433684 RepID=A0A5C6MYP0_9TELE|nr:hypothetical protein D4764_06G0007210 [Takifugu flavidus]
MGTLQSKDSWKSDAGPSASLETTYPLPYQPGTTATIGLTRKRGIPNVGITPPQATLPDTTLCESSVLTYCRNLTKSLSEIRARVKAALPSPADQQLHPLHPGDYVVIKDFRRTRWNQKRWQGPFQILLVTQTAVKVAERATWIHASHCKKVPEPKEPVSRE